MRAFNDIMKLITMRIHRTNMLQYAHGLSMSMKVSASLNCGILLNITAKVLLVQCISMVSFNDLVR